MLADIDETFCLDPGEVERRITPKTSGIIAAHMSGAPADIKALQKVAKQHGLFLLEDCARVPGEVWTGKRLGPSATSAFSVSK